MKRRRDPKENLQEHKSLVPSAYRLFRPEEVQWARRRLWSVLNIPLPKNNSVTAPTAQPISLQRDRIDALIENKHRYRVSLKADGVRYILLLTQKRTSSTAPPENVALMFDRALTPYEVSIWAPEPYFANNSLFDGELVVSLKTSELTYLVFDVMVINGDRVGDNENYDKRLTIVQECFETPLFNLFSTPKCSSECREKLL